jgi:hypothetical protein
LALGEDARRAAVVHVGRSQERQRRMLVIVVVPGEELVGHALGGARARIAGQVLVESVTLSLAGGAFGLLLGTLGIRALLAVNTAGLPRVGPDGSFAVLDWRVLVFSLALSVGPGLLFGLLPALQISRTDVPSALNDRGGRGGSGTGQGRTRAAMVVMEVALALTLVIGSALLIRSTAGHGCSLGAGRNFKPGSDSA